MHFHQFGQARNDEIPFVRQSIAPASRVRARLKTFDHDGHDVGSFRAAVEIEVISQVRPMIEGFDYDHVADLFERFTNRRQKRQWVLYARLLFYKALLHTMRAMNSVRP